MGNNCCGADDTGECNTDPVRTSANFEANKDKTFVIIGAGPAGIHMAHILVTKGYKNVIILEKSAQNRKAIGKTFTIDDSDINNNINDYGTDKDGNKREIFHELGTCYLHPEYFVIENLLNKFDKDNKQLRIPSRAVFFDENDENKEKDSRKYKDGTSFMAWAMSEAEKLAYPKAFHWLPDIITGGAAFADSVIRYNKLHEEIFGEQSCNKKHGFLGKPKNFEKTKKLFDMTFLKFLEKNKLYGLIPTFVYSQSVQGYGTLDSIPAYYGLFWNTPELLKQVTDIIRAFADEPNVTCLSKGFGSLWKNMIEECELNIQYGINITSINRHLKDANKQMEITYNEKKILKCDYIFFACGMHNNVTLLKDATNEEIDIWKCMTAHTLCATLYETDVIPESADTSQDGKFAAGHIYPNRIWNADGELYAQRNSSKCLLGHSKYKQLVKDGKIKKDRYVAYQFLGRVPEKDDASVLLDKFKKGLKDTGVVKNDNYRVIDQECWEYFPIWDQNGINKGYPWYVKDELQGKYKNTFYIGSSVCFESVLSVVEYNNELDHKFHF